MKSEGGQEEGHRAPPHYPGFVGRTPRVSLVYSRAFEVPLLLLAAFCFPITSPPHPPHTHTINEPNLRSPTTKPLRSDAFYREGKRPTSVVRSCECKEIVQPHGWSPDVTLTRYKPRQTPEGGAMFIYNTTKTKKVRKGKHQKVHLLRNRKLILSVVLESSSPKIQIPLPFSGRTAPFANQKSRKRTKAGETPPFSFPPSLHIASATTDNAHAHFATPSERRDKQVRPTVELNSA